MSLQDYREFIASKLHSRETKTRLCSVNPAALVLIGAGLTLAVMFAAVLL